MIINNITDNMNEINNMPATSGSIFKTEVTVYHDKDRPKAGK